MKESIFCTEIIKSLRQAGCFAFKIPDSPASYGSSKMRFSPGKAFDIHAVTSGVPLAIEAKLYKQFKGFGLNQLRDEQIDTLNAYWEVGGRAYVALNIRIPACREKNQKRENRLLLFEWPLRFHSKAEIEAYPLLPGARDCLNWTAGLSR